MSANMLDEPIKYQYKANTCYLAVPLNMHPKLKTMGATQHVEIIRNCDIFIDNYEFIIYVDVTLYRFQSRRCFDIRELKSLVIQYDTKECCFKIQLLCLRPEAKHPPKPKSAINEENIQILQCAKVTTNEIRDAQMKLELWKLRRITDICQLQIDNASDKLLRFESNFTYGFARRFSGKLSAKDCLEYDHRLMRVLDPQKISPLRRTINRVIEENQRFSREQYKLNFAVLQVPDGHEDPLKYKPNYADVNLTHEQSKLLHNLTCKPEHKKKPEFYQQSEIDCGLVSILLAICYDIRCTYNEPNCESSWTRSILSATLCYFEPFVNYKTVIISFMRRMLIYPLYRNFGLGKLCIHDVIGALNAGRNWLLKQLLLTHQQFSSSDRDCNIFNIYYIEDYIRYISNENVCPLDHLVVIAKNIKNVERDIEKRHLELNIADIESELLKELIRFRGALTIKNDDGESDDNDDVDDDDNDNEEDDADDEEADEDDDEYDGNEDALANENDDDVHNYNINDDFFEVLNDSFEEQVNGSSDSYGLLEQNDIDYDDISTSSDTEGNSVIEQCSSEATNK